MPVAKVTAAAIGGAVATVAVFVCGQVGVVVPGEVGAAVATLVSFAAGYLKAA